MRKIRTLSANLAIDLFTLSCAGARGDLQLDALTHPVSMSGYLWDDRGRAVSARDLEVVGEFTETRRRWGLLYSFVPVSSTPDLGSAVDQEIRSAGGEGVINLTVTSSGCGINYIPVVSLLPVWPGCANVEVRGQIVRRR